MAGITYTLPGITPLNQLLEASNPRDDCVAVSNAVLANAYTGSKYTGTALKALAYSPSYVGFMSESRFVATMAKLGVQMVPISHPTQQLLIDELHWQIEHYHRAAVITMPSQWNSAPTTVKGYNPRTYSGYSHVGLMCGSGPGMLRCANPWGGFFQDQSDAWWAQRLLEGQIWVGVRLPTPPAVQATPAASQAQPAVSTSNVVTVAQLQAKIALAQKALS